MKTKESRNAKAMLMAACAILAVMPATAQAQQRSQQVSYNIPAQDLGTALTELARQSNREIYFPADLARGKRAPRLSGKMTFERALQRLLGGSGLRYRTNASGSVVIEVAAEAGAQARGVDANAMAAEGRDADGKAAIPDILVIGKRDWNLNLDIQRTADDPQPYVVFTHDQIQRSGATNLEDFFRDNLGANNSGTTTAQNTNLQGLSSINLRGLGLSSTLILVDGRRYAQPNSGGGSFTQSSIAGIPLDAIERIEVLASSASGIYGSNAVGGVINIIMRRDFRGIEATAYYGNSTRLDAFENRLSLNGSFPIEHGRTRISFTGSWQKTGGLQEGDRDYIARGRALLLANSPNYFSTLTQPIPGATPNIASVDGSNLVLKPIYGGTALGSRITFVPAGFRGIAQDGVAALVANAGKQNFNLSPTTLTVPAGGDGALAPLLSPQQSYSGSFTVRREFNKWLSLYGEFGYGHAETRIPISLGARVYTLPAGSVDNPFTKSINVSVPIVGDTRYQIYKTTTKRALAGAIVKLPFDWQAAIDLTWNWTTFGSSNVPPGIDVATNNAINTGAISLLRDTAQYPPTFTYLDSPATGVLGSSHAYSRSYTLKLAGPLPLLRLWGGKPIVTLLAEQDKQTMGEYVSFSNAATLSSILFTPARSQRTESVYGEVRFPIIGKDNHVPLVRELELQVAGRYDHYVGVGAENLLTCFPAPPALSFNGPLPASAYSTACPAAGAQPAFATTRNGSTNPTVALRWAVTEDLTFRGSYSTGYQPPALNAVIAADPSGALGAVFPTLAGKVLGINVTDPLRGNEMIGVLTPPIFTNAVNGVFGGNPNVDPQTSTSWSFGAILTPRWIPGLRLSVDWSRITQNNVYFSPQSLVLNAATQGAFNDFMAAHPERFVRDTNPATFGAFKVGPIIYMDLSTANMSYARSEAVDFAGSYDMQLGGGHLTVQAAATWLRDLTTRLTPSSALVDSTGVIDNSFLALGGGQQGGVEWKGNGSIVYAANRWTAGIRARYVGSYWLKIAHTVDPLQGSAKLPAQAYVDIFGSFKLFPKTELRAGVNNVLDKSPPINASTGKFYSYFGDPRRANFYVSINQKF